LYLNWCVLFLEMWNCNIAVPRRNENIFQTKKG
jgi:hypothetical protein